MPGLPVTFATQLVWGQGTPQAGPTIRSVASQVGNSAGNGSVVVAKPAGTVASDLLLLHVHVASSATVTVTRPAGWPANVVDSTQFIDGAGTTHIDLVLWYTAGGAEPATYTVGITTAGTWAATAEIVALAGASSSAPINSHAALHDTYAGATGNVLTGSLPATTAVTTLVGFFTTTSPATPTTFSVAAGFTEQVDHSAGAVAPEAVSTEMSTFESTESGFTGTWGAGWTGSQSDGVGVGVAVAGSAPVTTALRQITLVQPQGPANNRLWHIRSLAVGRQPNPVTSAGDQITVWLCRGAPPAVGSPNPPDPPLGDIIWTNYAPQDSNPPLLPQLAGVQGALVTEGQQLYVLWVFTAQPAVGTSWALVGTADEETVTRPAGVAPEPPGQRGIVGERTGGIIGFGRRR